VTILIDTAPLVALCDPRDSLNRAALTHLKLLAKSDFAVCEPVLAEACFHLWAPSQRNRLQEMLEALDVLPISVELDRSFWRDVFDWLEKYRDHHPDWTDGYLAVLSGRDRKYRVWTYDKEFRTTWRRPNGSTIPMAIRL
jgi:predicted nucleic acid-binding protein